MMRSGNFAMVYGTWLLRARRGQPRGGWLAQTAAFSSGTSMFACLNHATLCVRDACTPRD